MANKSGNSAISLFLIALQSICAGGVQAWPAPPPPAQLLSATQSSVPSTFFGMNVGDPVKTWPTVQIGALGHQTRLGWAPREPQKGVYNWTDLDNYVNIAHSHGLNDFIYDLGGNVPSWAAPSSTSLPTNIQDWDDYINAVVTRYKGQIIYYEIWNEANNSKSWTGTFTDMVLLAQHAWNDIKAIDPNALVLTPSTTGPAGLPWGWLTQYLQAGGSLYADIGTFHGYTAKTGVTPYPMPEQESTSGCVPPPPNASSPCTGSVMTKVNRFRSVLDKNGMAGKPLFDTEGSWGQNVNITDPDTRVAWLARWYILQASLGVARADWFAWGIPVTGTGTGPKEWGSLLDSSGNITPAGTAYGVLYNWLVAATFSTPCAVGSDGTTWTCGLSRSGSTYQGLLVWNTAASTSYAPSSQYIQYRDLTGITFTVNGTVTIGIKPIILENQNP